MKPYFETSHLAGLLLLIVTMAWGTMELAHAGNTRDGAARAGGGGRRLAVVSVVIATPATPAYCWPAPGPAWPRRTGLP